MKKMADHAQIKIYLQDEVLRISNLKQFEVRSLINEHATMEIEAILYDEDIKHYSEEIAALQTIRAVVTDQEECTTIFEGLVYKIDIQVVGTVAYMYLSGISYSYLLDITVKDRSFQNKSQTYGELIQKVFKEYPKSQFKFSNSEIKAKTINKPYIQYHETDWAFLKRIISKFNIGIVPAMEREGLKIWFDAKNEEAVGDITADVYSYKLLKDFKQFKEIKENHKKDVSEIDYVSFVVQTSRIMFTGTQVIFNKIKLYVKDVKVILENAKLYFYYTLVPVKALSTPIIKHNKLSGISLNGKVLAVKEHVVLVHLDIDSSQKKEGAYWFPFATVSASSHNVGWYFMPEVGDGVRVYFEDGEEEKGVAIQAVPIQPSYKDPNVRYISTIHGKEVKITPGGIYITVKGEKLYIKLDDEEGISICSDTNINIIAQEDINILSDTKIEMAAETINITTGSNGETTMTINEDVTVDAKQVTVNGK